MSILPFPDPNEPDPDDVFWADHETETTDQIGGALDQLNRPDDVWLDWPWPDLSALAGAMAPKTVWFACAFSGGGKTTFVRSLIRAWVATRTKVYVMPLETDATDFRHDLACLEVGIDPGMVNEGRLRFHPNRVEIERRIKAELHAQANDRATRDYLKVKGVDEIDLRRLTLAAEEARDWGAKALVVDHIDHVTGDGKSAGFALSEQVNKGALKLAKRYELACLFTSQMNNETVRGGRDKLAQFGPAMPHHVYMGGVKRQVSTGMLSIHRRLRDPLPHETPDEYKAAIQRARTGADDVQTALAQGIMAVTAMKLRNAGQREGKRCFLAVEQGKVSGIAEKDHHTTTRGSRAQP